jgi:hypothetical protein
MKILIILLIGAVAAVVLVDHEFPRPVMHDPVALGPDDYVWGLCHHAHICDPRNPHPM